MFWFYLWIIGLPTGVIVGLVLGEQFAAVMGIHPLLSKFCGALIGLAIAYFGGQYFVKDATKRIDDLYEDPPPRPRRDP